MNVSTIILFAVAVMTLVGFVGTALFRRNSVTVLGLGIVLALLGAGLSYYAKIESGSLPWAVGYAFFSAGSIALTVWNWLPSNKTQVH
ncbi:MAG: hypothetical protein KDA87_22485 [Planctomycetales bacterium]|nr:hypothetical protein [Planctomycetales bacterium]